MASWIEFFIEIIGTVAFASSGALTGIHKNMDIFGVNVLGITTAIGGGIIRDIILGIHPPGTFRNPIYVLVSIVTATLLFIVVYYNRQLLESRMMAAYDKVMMTMDAVGLGAFTVIGIYTAVSHDRAASPFLLIFVGMITGIGGGMLRDVMAKETPFVLVKHIYAVASLAGALVCIGLMELMDSSSLSMIAGGTVVIIIRMMAAHYRWNLPRIR